MTSNGAEDCTRAPASSLWASRQIQLAAKLIPQFDGTGAPTSPVAAAAAAAA